MKFNISQIRALIKDESTQKKLLVPLLLLFVIVCGATANQLGLFNKGNPPVSSSKSQPAPVKTATLSAVSADTAGEMTKAKFDIAQSNPFVADKSVGVPPVAPAGTMAAAPQANINGSLPVIPGYQPRPNVGSVPIPSMPPIPGSGYVGEPQVATAPQNAVKGVFTGNDGKNMAIMSDGKIIQEGDNYGGNRITAISGNGIQFDNGNNISYGIK